VGQVVVFLPRILEEETGEVEDKEDDEVEDKEKENELV